MPDGPDRAVGRAAAPTAAMRRRVRMTRRPETRMRVLLTFDLDAESAQVRKMPQLPASWSKGQFARVGAPRILDLLRGFGIQSTFFVPSWTAHAYAELVREIAERGHEIAAHGHLHENLSQLEEAGERDVHARSLRILEEVVGRRPLGFRAPYWEWSPRTLALLAEYGFTYDSSLMNDDRPYRLSTSAGPAMYELPVDASLDDWTLFEESRQSPEAVLAGWRAEFDAAYDLGLGYFQLTMHPECIGRASRIRMLERLIRHMRTKPGVAFLRCDELVAHLRTSADPDRPARRPGPRSGSRP